ncbi:tumor necrosis factor receptor superfamily member 6B-like [Myripristis murdjan]|uniref:Tumor necrosis factor receptor superfamily member 6B-like n=1 Tax=Myripristis murdjan TaxID=586833 RepID=A0A667XHT6_9TELE|nr:tumor necrosis factor receptor superfamily member 6B-like [Myripristis murdjan]
MLLSVLAVILWARTAGLSASAALMTFQHRDASTGLAVVCDRCPPGKCLQAPCTATTKTECAPCPTGSFTELWNHVTKCLRCSMCGHNQEVTRPCSAERDCSCQCKEGFYFQKKYEMCVKHTDCPPGHGVLIKGTAQQDTVCQLCPRGSFSDQASSLQNCTLHRGCDAPGQRLLLKGSTWHDSVCTTCEELGSRDGADYLREILPAFFVHQKMPIKRLQRLLHKLPPQNGMIPQNKISTRSRRDLYAMINTWMVNVSTEQLRQLPMTLTKIRAKNPARKLENKLRQIDSALASPCVTDSPLVEVVVMAE